MKFLKIMLFLFIAASASKSLSMQTAFQTATFAIQNAKSIAVIGGVSCGTYCLLKYFSSSTKEIKDSFKKELNKWMPNLSSKVDAMSQDVIVVKNIVQNQLEEAKNELEQTRKELNNARLAAAHLYKALTIEQKATTEEYNDTLKNEINEGLKLLETLQNAARPNRWTLHGLRQRLGW